jgi:prepilin-type N-terminal cleavage/methylation domain-containing protein/prepilin-type processing-associated H-X9-DG protein
MKRQSGLTLVEILVVMAIIAMLIAILLPGLTYSRQLAYRITCLNNLKQLGIAVEAYVQSYKFYPVCVSDVNERWSDFLADKSIAAKKMLGVPVSLWPFHQTAGLYKCPILSKIDCDISYCYNSQAGRERADGNEYAAVMPDYIPPIPPQQRQTKPILLSPQEVKSPSIFVLLYDLPMKPQQVSIGPVSYDPYKDIDPDDYESFRKDPNEQGFLWYYNYWPADGPHNKGYDILFSDGHVKWHKRWSDSSMSRDPLR